MKIWQGYYWNYGDYDANRIRYEHFSSQRFRPNEPLQASLGLSNSQEHTVRSLPVTSEPVSTPKKVRGAEGNK